MGVSDACKYDYYSREYMYLCAAEALTDPYLHWNDKCKLGCPMKANLQDKLDSDLKLVRI